MTRPLQSSARLLAQVHSIPLTRLVCFSEKTFLMLRKVLGGLVLLLGRPRRLRRRLRIPAAPVAVWEPLQQRLYEPSAMTNVWSLRLGVDGGLEGWRRAWRWRRDQEEIGPGSWRRWLSIRG